MASHFAWFHDALLDRCSVGASMTCRHEVLVHQSVPSLLLIRPAQHFCPFSVAVMHYLLPAALLCATTLASLPYAPERLAPSGGDRLGRRSPFPGPGFQKGFLSSKKGFLEPEAHAPAKGKGEGALQRISVQEQHALDQSSSFTHSLRSVLEPPAYPCPLRLPSFSARHPQSSPT